MSLALYRAELLHRDGRRHDGALPYRMSCSAMRRTGTCGSKFGSPGETGVLLRQRPVFSSSIITPADANLRSRQERSHRFGRHPAEIPPVAVRVHPQVRHDGRLPRVQAACDDMGVTPWKMAASKPTSRPCPGHRPVIGRISDCRSFRLKLAWVEGFEPPAFGFGDQRSTI